jgi:hypothetical protein
MTVASVLPCLAALAVATALYRRRLHVPDDGSTMASQYRFLGLLGIASSVANIVLILGEGAVVPFLHGCG